MLREVPCGRRIKNKMASFFTLKSFSDEAESVLIVVLRFFFFQGTLEKLDIQTETNNKLLAQQDKQQV